MATAADRLQDLLIANQVDLERFRLGEQQELARLLRRLDRELVEMLRRRIETFGDTGPDAIGRKGRSFRNLIEALTRLRTRQWEDVETRVRQQVRAYADFVNGRHAEMLEESIGLEEFAAVVLGAAALTRIVREEPFRGRRLAEHVRDARDNDLRILRSEVTAGVAEGQSADDIARRVRGTRAQQFRDSPLQRTRNMIGAVVATALTHTNARVSEQLWQENGIVSGLVWTAVLDGRTTAVCRGRDGHGVPLPGKEKEFRQTGIPLLQPRGARPPAHFNCRSVMVATMAPTLVVPPHRTAVATTLSSPARRRNFRAEARRREGSNWSNLSERQRRRRIRRVAVEWAEENIGTVPAQTDYASWLRRQSKSFQNDVLGPTRAKLWREGGLEMDKFADRSGKTLTLDQLRERYPGAFRRAGIGE